MAEKEDMTEQQYLELVRKQTFLLCPKAYKQKLLKQEN